MGVGYLAAGGEVLALGVDALVVVDVVLPAVLGLVHVREPSIDTCFVWGGEEVFWLEDSSFFFLSRLDLPAFFSTLEKSQCEELSLDWGMIYIMYRIVLIACLSRDLGEGGSIHTG